MSEVNVEKLRKDLIDYFGTAMSNGFPMAMIDLSKIENASEKELINIARNNGIDLQKYIENER